MIADIDKRKVVRKSCAERGNITLLKDVKIRKRFGENVTTLVDGGVPNLWDTSRMGFWRNVMRCVGLICGGDTWWWNEQFQGRRMHTRPCVKIMPSRIRGGMKHEK